MAWIELHQTLREHKKMFACADDLGVKRTEMIGILVSLWLWALDNAQDGSLAGVSDKTIARVCDFPEKKAGKLVEALRKNRFLEKDGDHYVIHDWYDYAGKLMERREKDRSRKQKANKTAAEFRGNSAGNFAEGTGNSHATVPNPTVPNPTVPYLTNTGDDISGDGDAREADERELLSIGLKAEEVQDTLLKKGSIGGPEVITRERVNRIIEVTEDLFRKYRPAVMPSAWDRRMVFALSDARDNCELVDYAFEQAHLAGKVSDWRFIAGIIRSLRARNIVTVQQAREWDEQRPDLTGEEAMASVNNLLQNLQAKEKGHDQGR